MEVFFFWENNYSLLQSIMWIFFLRRKNSAWPKPQKYPPKIHITLEMYLANNEVILLTKQSTFSPLDI